jgi:hypothetical protein
MTLLCQAMPDASDKSTAQTFRTARALLEKDNISLDTCTTWLSEDVLLVSSESARGPECQHWSQGFWR